MGHMAAPEGVRYEADTVGGIPGWWCLPDGPRGAGAILHLHGGWYSWGTAAAYRHLVGHIAARARVPAFVPDYRLAPEHPFPAAAMDVRACWNELAARGLGPLAIVGDSAGGGLALALASDLAQERPRCSRRSPACPPLRIHVGDDEGLLDDSLRYAERAKAQGVDSQVHVWQGLPHGFLSGVGKLTAEDQALADIGTFIAERLQQAA